MSRNDDTTNQPESSGRRRLFRGGAAAPVLLTLVSRPVLAVTCFSPSETLSGTLSHKADNPPVCNGRSPGVWRELAEGNAQAKLEWPIDPGTKWDTYFVGIPAYYDYSKGRYRTLLEIMQLAGNGDPYKLGFHFIGALLNILTGRVDNRAMTVEGLQRMWSKYVEFGEYVPFPGATGWGSQAIKDYLKNTGISP